MKVWETDMLGSYCVAWIAPPKINLLETQDHDHVMLTSSEQITICQKWSSFVVVAQNWFKFKWKGQSPAKMFDLAQVPAIK